MSRFPARVDGMPRHPKQKFYESCLSHGCSRDLLEQSQRGWFTKRFTQVTCYLDFVKQGAAHAINVL